jgi:hypothetical protein
MRIEYAHVRNRLCSLETPTTVRDTTTCKTSQNPPRLYRGCIRTESRMTISRLTGYESGPGVLEMLLASQYRQPGIMCPQHNLLIYELTLATRSELARPGSLPAFQYSAELSMDNGTITYTRD